MRTTHLSAQKLTYLLLPTLLFLGLNVQADNHAAAAPGVLESFLCTYNDGKDRDDLNAATSYMVKQADKAGIDLQDAYLWTHVKGTSDADTIWHTAHESMDAFAANFDAFGAAEEMSGVGDRFDSVAECTPVVGTIELLNARSEEDDGGGTTPRVVASYACSNLGGGQAGTSDVNAHIAGVFKAMGDTAPIATYTLTPLNGGGLPDTVYFNVFANAAEWATFEQALSGSPQGQMLQRHFGTVFDCAFNMWVGEQVVGG